MSVKIKDLDELQDSKLLFEKDIPSFGYILILFLGVALFGGILWGINAPKTSIIHTAGNVTSPNSNYVMSAYSGEIAEYSIEEGKQVDKGDELFTIKGTDYNLQKKELEAKQTDFEEQKTKYQLLVQSIKDDQNYFEETKQEDSLYYNMYQKYKTEIEQNEFDVESYKTFGYSDESLEASMEVNKEKTAGIYYTAIENAEQSIKNCQVEIDTIKAQLNTVSSGTNELKIKAPVSGIVHLLSDYKAGVVVQSGAPLALIAPENEEYAIECYLEAADVVRTNVKDKVQLSISGLSQSLYGNITGTVLQIDSNTTASNDESQKKPMFKVLIKPENTYLISKEGNMIHLFNGMEMGVQIIYDKETYMDYLLDKLGFVAK